MKQLLEETQRLTLEKAKRVLQNGELVSMAEVQLMKAVMSTMTQEQTGQSSAESGHSLSLKELKKLVTQRLISGSEGAVGKSAQELVELPDGSLIVPPTSVHDLPVVSLSAVVRGGTGGTRR